MCYHQKLDKTVDDACRRSFGKKSTDGNMFELHQELSGRKIYKFTRTCSDNRAGNGHAVG
jgi:hypothetical protein